MRRRADRRPVGSRDACAAYRCPWPRAPSPESRAGTPAAAGCPARIGIADLIERCPSASPIPIPCSAACVMAAFISRPVSSADAETAVRQHRFHVFAGAARQRDFEIVDRRRAVQRERRGVAAAHQVDQHRRQAAFDDMAAQAPEDRLAGCRAQCNRSTTRRERSPARIRGSDSSSPITPAALHVGHWRNRPFEPCRRAAPAVRSSAREVDAA